MAEVLAGLELTSDVADGGIAHILDTDVAFASGTLLDLRNNGTSRFSVDHAGAVTATSFAGDGGSLTALNATQLTTGTVPSSRISEASVTQHESALTVAWSQLTFAGSSLADLATRSAADLSSGTLPSGRLSGSYTGITGVGTLTAGSWQGSVISETYLPGTSGDRWAGTFYGTAADFSDSATFSAASNTFGSDSLASNANVFVRARGGLDLEARTYYLVKNSGGTLVGAVIGSVGGGLYMRGDAGALSSPHLKIAASGAATFSDDVFGGRSGDSNFTIAGGTSSTFGGRIDLFSPDHASAPDQVRIFNENVQAARFSGGNTELLGTTTFSAHAISAINGSAASPSFRRQGQGSGMYFSGSSTLISSGSALAATFTGANTTLAGTLSVSGVASFEDSVRLRTGASSSEILYFQDDAGVGNNDRGRIYAIGSGSGSGFGGSLWLGARDSSNNWHDIVEIRAASERLVSITSASNLVGATLVGAAGTAAFVEGSGLEIRRTSGIPTLRLQNSAAPFSSEISSQSDHLRYRLLNPGDHRWFASSSNERMRLTDAGHLGLGTTDIDSYNSIWRAFRIGGLGSVVGATSTGMILGHNFYMSGTSIVTGANYMATDEAAVIRFRDTGTIVLSVAPSGTADTAISWTDALEIANNGRATFKSDGSTGVYVILDSFDNGTNIGPRLFIDRNTNASTPAAGHFGVNDKGGTNHRLWPDDSGVWRTGVLDPTNANDTSGTVVGTQTSDVRVKNVLGQFTDYEDALGIVRGTPLFDYTFLEDSQRGDKPMTGYVIHEEDRGGWYSMNDHRDDNMATLDEANVLGYHGAAIRALADRSDDTRSRVERLEAAMMELPGGEEALARIGA